MIIKTPLFTLVQKPLDYLSQKPFYQHPLAENIFLHFDRKNNRMENAIAFSDTLMIVQLDYKQVEYEYSPEAHEFLSQAHVLLSSLTFTLELPKITDQHVFTLQRKNIEDLYKGYFCIPLLKNCFYKYDTNNELAHTIATVYSDPHSPYLMCASFSKGIIIPKTPIAINIKNVRPVPPSPPPPGALKRKRRRGLLPPRSTAAHNYYQCKHIPCRPKYYPPVQTHQEQ